MRNLKSLLERFTKSLNHDTDTKEAIIKVIASRCGLELSPENVSLKDGVLVISAGASAKTEIMLKSEGIRDELRGSYRVFVSRILFN